MGLAGQQFLIEQSKRRILMWYLSVAVVWQRLTLSCSGKDFVLGLSKSCI